MHLASYGLNLRVLCVPEGIAEGLDARESSFVFLFIFFFQAEDGIRDWSVTGVQTCALPISFFNSNPAWSDPITSFIAGSLSERLFCGGNHVFDGEAEFLEKIFQGSRRAERARSEERRVGKECRCRWWANH